MFSRRPQYEAVNSSSEQHILTVLRFHEARLGKIEKHLITTNKQLQNLISVYKGDQKNNTNKKVSPNNTVNGVDKQSFSLLKTMMENLTNQVVTSQSFMKEIKDVVSNIITRNCTIHYPSIVAVIIFDKKKFFKTLKLSGYGKNSLNK